MAKTNDATVDNGHHNRIIPIEVGDIYGVTAIGGILGYCTLPGKRTPHSRYTVCPGAVVGAYGGIAPSCLAGIARIPGRAYTDIVGTTTAIGAGDAAAFVFATIQQSNSKYAQCKHGGQKYITV
jgi:hypothetical protein